MADRTADLERLAGHHRRILDAVGEGIYGVDADGRITFVNPAAAQLLGYAPEELLSRGAHETFHAVDTDPRGCGCHLDDAMRGGEVVRRSDENYLRRDRTPFPVDITAAPHWAAAAATGAVVVFSDISALRAVERMKQEFISVVSHELRTPLTSIRGSARATADAAGRDDAGPSAPRPAAEAAGVTLVAGRTRARPRALATRNAPSVARSGVPRRGPGQRVGLGRTARRPLPDPLTGPDGS